jgi:O-methyltransferase
LENESFAFVNIDADLYNPIKEGCAFFYPRLVPGGILIIHDYNHKWEGAMKAVNEFSKTIPENIIEIADMHGSVMIIKNKNI